MMVVGEDTNHGDTNHGTAITGTATTVKVPALLISGGHIFIHANNKIRLVFVFIEQTAYIFL